MTRLDDARMHRSDGDLVDLAAIHAQHDFTHHDAALGAAGRAFRQDIAHLPSRPAIT